MLTQERVRELFHYDPETGQLIWAVQRGRSPAGVRAGRVHHRGYREVRIDGVLYREHRIIWLWMTGAEPEDECDHANRDRADNRWDNLRAATRLSNMQNLGISPLNTSGLPGASFHKARGKWRATITLAGKSNHLGHFDTAQEAHEVYCAAKAKIHLLLRPNSESIQTIRPPSD